MLPSRPGVNILIVQHLVKSQRGSHSITRADILIPAAIGWILSGRKRRKSFVYTFREGWGLQGFAGWWHKGWSSRWLPTGVRERSWESTGRVGFAKGVGKENRDTLMRFQREAGVPIAAFRPSLFPNSSTSSPTTVCAQAHACTLRDRQASDALSTLQPFRSLFLHFRLTQKNIITL